MSRVALALAFVAAFLAGGLLMNGLTIQGQDRKPDEKKANELETRGQLYPKWIELGLSKDQIVTIYKIQVEHRAQRNIAGAHFGATACVSL